MPKQKGNGEGSIIKLPNGKYKATFTLEVIRDEQNKVIKQPRKTFTHEKKGEVQKWLNELINEKQNNSLLVTDHTTVKQWLNLWIDKYKKNTFKTRTYEEYKTLINIHLVPAIGNIELQKLTTADLQELYTKKISDGKSPQTVKHIHVCINGALKQAIKEGIIKINVASSCEIPKIERKPVQTLTKEEIKKLLGKNKDHHFYSLLLLELGTGLRRAELLALHWRNIDLNKGILYVEGNVSETKNGVIYQTTPKTKSSVRSVFLPTEVVAELNSYKEKTPYPNENDVVFPNPKGKYMRPSSLTQIFKYTWLQNAGLQQRSFHSLRHTHATMLLAQNVHAKIVQQRLGHANISTTLDIYSHALPDMQKQAANKINKLLKL